MKKLLFMAAFVVACVCYTQNVSAMGVLGSYQQSLNSISAGGALYAGCAEDYCFNQVKYVKIEFDNPNKANVRAHLLYDTSANHFSSNYYSSSTLTIDGKDHHIIYFIPQDMDCPSGFTTCVKVSPNHTIGTANNTRVSQALDFTGVKIENKSLLKTLKMTNGKITYYYGPFDANA